MPIPYARTGNASSEMMAQSSAAPVAPPPPPPPSAPFSPGVTTQEVRVRVDFALRGK